MYQFYEANEIASDVYSQPMEALERGRKNWSSMTAGLSPEELADFEKAKNDLEMYERVHDIFEYSTELNECIQNLELRITANNPVVPMNIYRAGSNTDPAKLVAEMEVYLKAYYDIIDQCKEFPDWQKKLRKELGSQVSYLAKQIDEDSHAEIVRVSEVYKRFDEEKQLFFK